MSLFSSQQRCPRCQFPLDPGVFICQQCGLNMPESASGGAALPPLSQPWPADPQEPPMPSEFLTPEGGATPSGWILPGQPTPGAFPPPLAAPIFPVPARPPRSRKPVLIALSIVLIIALVAGSSVAYIFTRPKPVIQVKSDYTLGATPIGSTTTSFHVTGQQFSTNANITFLLDGQPAAGVKTFLSDGKGNVKADLTVTTDWTLGKHTLTARDDQGYTTKAGIAIEIVGQGLSGTPGPKGAPADNSSFDLSVTIVAKFFDGSTATFQRSLTIIGHPDPAGGDVCAESDHGQGITYTGTLDNSTETFVETMTLACHGTYKQGHLTYTETGITDKFVLGNGVHCASPHPYTYAAIDGTFTSPALINGKYHRDYFQADCTDGTYIYRDNATGTWEGSL